MSTELQRLIETVKSGNLEALDALVRAIRDRGSDDVGLLVELVRAPEAGLRRAAILAGAGRAEPELLEALEALAGDSVPTVRETLAEALLASPDWRLGDVLDRLLRDPDEKVRLRAVRAAASRPLLRRRLLEILVQDDDWEVRRAAAETLAAAEPREVVGELVRALGCDGDQDVSRAAADSAERHLTTQGGFPKGAEFPPFGILRDARTRIDLLGRDRYPRLSEWLEIRLHHDVDVDRLREFGADLTLDAERGRLARAKGADRICDAVLRLLEGSGPRSAVLLGEPGVGKTAIVHEIVHRLRALPEGGWRVFRITPSELLAGTRYLGEWQTKVRELVQLVRAPRRVLVYVPNLEELSMAGRSSDSEANVATMLAPHIESNEIVILGESTPDAYRFGLGRTASLRRLFSEIEVREADPAETMTILNAVCEEAGAALPDSFLDRIVDLANYYFGGTAQPGRAVGLLRRVLESVAATGELPTPRDILTTLSRSTGIPVHVLDDEITLDLDMVRGYFEKRVMGQEEAVEAVVDLVALIKAGLTDPNKPFGIFLFIGPTGVGKTELARSLSEYLFGDPGRIVRFDMSEFATYDAFERLIGRHGNPGLLTSRVRENPFSVVLLDEIEKAHTNIFDLCLQIFDAGRLTDARGATADFRRTILILTSNVGSGVPTDSPLGFGAGPAPVPDRDTVLRELRRFFRPEFLNRLDRILWFRPLGEGTAERIARREVAQVIERSGIARRRLVVDVDPSVVSLLLRKGYSRAFGARPLKRTVERLVLMPIARAVASGSVPVGSVLRLVAAGDGVEVRIAPTEVEGEDSVAVGREPVRTEWLRRSEALLTEADALRGRARPLAERKTELLARSSAPDFWNDRSRAVRDLDEIHRLDGVFSALDYLERSSRDLADRFRRPVASGRGIEGLQERVESLEQEARRIAFLLACRSERDLGDAIVTLTLIRSDGTGLDAVERFARMYLGLVRRRRLDAEVMDDRRGGDPPEDTIVLAVSGAGAFGLLSQEAGLHILNRYWTDRTTGGKRHEDRDVVRVEVLPAPFDESPYPKDEVQVEIQALSGVAGRLIAKPRLEIRMIHVPSMTSVRAWTAADRGEAVERVTPLLRARAILGSERSERASSETIVRRYTLGPTPLVRDRRTGRSTGRIDRVLRGHLDRLLVPPAES